MKKSRFTIQCVAVLAAGVGIAGCGQAPGDTAANDLELKQEHGLEDEEESPSGASFKVGTGILLTNETREILGLEIVDVSERNLPETVDLTVQVFDENHRPLPDSADHSGCDLHGSGFIAADTTAAVRSGQTVALLKNTNAAVPGIVLSVQKALALGELEIVVGFTNAGNTLMPGEFVPARISLPRDGEVTVVPRSAVLRTAEGTFVYVVNGNAYFRTAVSVGASNEGWVEITDGLLAGDQVVTRPVETLWLIELRATKGGGHCH